MDGSYWSQVEILTQGKGPAARYRLRQRIAERSKEAELLELAPHATAAHVEQGVRAYRRAGRLAEREQVMAPHTTRELTCYRDEDGCLVTRARQPAEAGAVVLRALEAAMDAQRAEADEAASEDVTAVTSAGNADGRSELEGGQRLAPDTARRIACDGSWLRIIEAAAGNPLACIFHHLPSRGRREAAVTRRTDARRAQSVVGTTSGPPAGVRRVTAS